MSETVKNVIRDYYIELQKSFKTGVIDFSKLHFDDNIKVVGPNERFDGKKKVEEMWQQFVPMVSHYDVKKQYFDEDSACTVLDCVVKSPQRAVATVELIFVKNGKITEIRPIYDTLAWQEIMQAPSQVS